MPSSAVGHRHQVDAFDVAHEIAHEDDVCGIVLDAEHDVLGVANAGVPHV